MTTPTPPNSTFPWARRTPPLGRPAPAPAPVQDATNLMRRAPVGGTAFVAPTGPSEAHTTCPITACEWSEEHATGAKIMAHFEEVHSLGQTLTELLFTVNALHHEEATTAMLDAERDALLDRNSELAIEIADLKAFSAAQQIKISDQADVIEALE